MVGGRLPNLPRHLWGEETVSQLSCQVILTTIIIITIITITTTIIIIVFICWCSYRRDIVHFGIDEYDDPLLTYYKVASYENLSLGVLENTAIRKEGNWIISSYHDQWDEGTDDI